MFDIRTSKLLSAVMGAALLAGALSACKGGTGRPVTIIAVDNAYDSQRFHNALAALVITHAFDGYAVTYSTASSTMNYESLKKGDIDISTETWTENYISYREDLANGEIVEAGVIVEESRQGFYVPRYVIEGDPGRGIPPVAPNLREVKDLAEYARIFPDDENPSLGRIYGAIPGWKADAVLHKKYQYYGLDTSFTYLRLGSEAALFASLMSAYNLGAAWAGYCYEPSWIAGKLPLVLLEDAPFEPGAFAEGKTAFPSQKLFCITSRQFPEKAPEVFEFLTNFKTGLALISQALAYLDDTKASHDEAALWFLKNHNELIDEWLPAERAKKLRGYLGN